MEQNIFEYQTYYQFLQDSVKAKKITQKHWSLGAWARQLGLASTASLTNIVCGRRPPSSALAINILNSIGGIQEQERNYFLLLVELHKNQFDSTLKENTLFKMDLLRKEWTESSESHDENKIEKSIKYLLKVKVLARNEQGRLFFLENGLITK